MRRNVLLIEPNYKNKFPPIALMKLATYHKQLGDNVVFFKGDIKDFIIERITDKCILKLSEIEPNEAWNTKKDHISAYIKTRKKSYFEALQLDKYENEFFLTHWITYYKDYFWKKIYLREPEWDRIFVTTLFTFYFDITVNTINELKPLLKKNGLFHIGGVLATLQPNEIEEATGIKPHLGLLNKPGELDGGTNNMIVDELPLDYTILEEIDYKYEMSNAYFAYMTRGCIRNCKFCAVKTLEPVFEDFIPIKSRIDAVKELCGEQKDLLLMDNNVIASERFDEIIQEIVDCGFVRNAKYIEPDFLSISIRNLKNGINERGYVKKAFKLIKDYYESIKNKSLSYEIYKIMEKNHIIKSETTTKDGLIKAYEEIYPYYAKTLNYRRPNRRKVDFNQGLDARLFNDHVASQFARICIHPLRIAFDDLKIKDTYINAIKMCANYGMNDFANYLLYNFNDKPADLYQRLRINVELCEDLNVSINSFPMKYHPLYGEHSHDRDYIGKFWNMKYIRAVQAILNATKGSIGRGLDYFKKAFGKNEDEFFLLLDMPDTYIVYRFFFEWLSIKSHPLSTANWLKAYNSLNEEEMKRFKQIIYSEGFSAGNHATDDNEKIDKLLRFYWVTRNSVQDKTGEFYTLKKEFDALKKQS